MLTAFSLHAEHADIVLKIFRVDPSSGNALDEANASSDQEPPAGGVKQRPVFKAKAKEPLVLQFILVNTYPHGVNKNVTVRYFVVPVAKLGQKSLPELENCLVRGQFQMHFKPKCRVGARVAFSIPGPGTTCSGWTPSIPHQTMNTSPRSTCRWNRLLTALCLGMLGVAGSGQEAKRSEPLPSFLDQFKANPEPDIRSRLIHLPGSVAAYLARPDTTEKLPAVVLVPEKNGPIDWYRLSAREISSIGYVVLLVEGQQADLTAAVRWLKKQDDVLPRQIGVVGWGSGGQAALTLAMSTSLQACVTCDGLPANGTDIDGRRTPVLAILSRAMDKDAGEIDRFRKSLVHSDAPWENLRVCRQARLHGPARNWRLTP